MQNNRSSSKDKDYTHKGDMYKRRKKVCFFCESKIEDIDYKDVKLLRKYISERFKILPRRATGTCAKHQRQVTSAIKIARNIALLPYTTE